LAPRVLFSPKLQEIIDDVDRPLTCFYWFLVY
jgi:hypothetical protein